ncbi:DUF4421 domain-containing protein [Chitinophaga sancti]|nr:DUF4421 domain-containing protein [Chitinophaga sancti]WQD65953.1 DUF4421 domain-containing protein [Chitinophaga sancti]
MFHFARSQSSSFIDKIGSWFQTENDTAYIEDHTKDLTTRFFGSRKYNYYNIFDRKRKTEVMYRPNTPFNVGFGFNYKFLGINVAFNLPFINSTDRYGKTKAIDLQAHYYLRKLVVDFYGQRYKGYYIANSRGLLNGFDEKGPLPVRPDIRNLNIGMSVEYIFNDKKFSYRAAYLQNEYQKKSAGSFLIGGELFTAKMKGDSSLIPRNITRQDFMNGITYSATSIFSVAANAGYAYTFVYKQHFFLTLSLSGGLGTNYTHLLRHHANDFRKFGLELNTNVRASFGYNSSKYFAGIHYVNLTTRSQSPIENSWQSIGAGNFRISLARRFGLKRQLF